MTSSRSQVRLAGAFYLIGCISAAVSFIVVRNRLWVVDNAPATAANIIAHETLYRWGFVAGLITLIADASVALLLYEILRPVSRTISLFAAAFRLIFVAVMTFNQVNYFLPVVLLRGPNYLHVFPPDQLQAVVLLSRRLFGVAYDTAEVFFSIHCILLGYLFIRSKFFPRALGAISLSGVIYMAVTMAHFVAPDLSRTVGILVLPAGILEWLLSLWLLFAGPRRSPGRPDALD